LEHEHQHPDHTIDWNTAAIYRNCKEKKGWSEATTYRNIFQKNRRQNTKDLPYDPTSIMHSAISETFIWNKIAMPLNSTLSEKDINLIKSIYPK
jgi:hypothetical protein